MAELWHIEYESPSGDTSTTTQPYLPMQWERGDLVLHRRAPHELNVVISRGGRHRLTDFKADRLWRISRNGVYYQAGFLGAPNLPGGSAARFIELPASGNAAALASLVRGMPKRAIISIVYDGFDVDGVISDILDDHRQGNGDLDPLWFPVSGRTIPGTSTALGHVVVAGRTAWEHILDLADVDGWSVRCGIASDGTWTFKAGPSVDADLTGSIQLFDGANCEVSDVRQDASQLTGYVHVLSHRQAAFTRLASAASGGATSITVDDSLAFSAGDPIIIGDGTANQETKTISSINYTTHVISISGSLGSAKSVDDVVRMSQVNSLRNTQRGTGAPGANHHHHWAALSLDGVVDATRRDKLGDTFLTAYDHVLATATVDVVDPALLLRMLNAGLHPGDSIKLTCFDQDLKLLYSNTTVKVQELALALTPTGATRARLTVGDPDLDVFAQLERRYQAAQQLASSSSY